jgi:hypothetical protein
MMRSRPLLAALFLAAVATLPLTALGAQAAPPQAPVPRAPAVLNLTGKWLITITTDAGGTATPTVTLTQKGDSLSGRYSSQMLGEADVVGTVGKDGAFEFRFEVQGAAVVYTGRVESQDALKGTAKFGEVTSGPFTAKRQ